MAAPISGVSPKFTPITYILVTFLIQCLSIELTLFASQEGAGELQAPSSPASYAVMSFTNNEDQNIGLCQNWTPQNRPLQVLKTKI